MLQERISFLYSAEIKELKFGKLNFVYKHLSNIQIISEIIKTVGHVAHFVEYTLHTLKSSKIFKSNALFMF